jgi:hypothetical protein
MGSVDVRYEVGCGIVRVLGSAQCSSFETNAHRFTIVSGTCFQALLLCRRNCESSVLTDLDQSLCAIQIQLVNL